MPSPEVLLFPADDSEPKQGFYSVTLRKDCVERALGFCCNEGLYFVYLDGEPLCNPSMNWKESFGTLYNLPMLKGRRLSVAEYSKLLKTRVEEKFQGIDHNQPRNQLTTEIAV